MNCSEVQERLSAYHDSELPPEEAARVAAHIAGCPSCAAELASFERLSGLTRRLTDPPVPTQMWDELQAKLNANQLPRESFVRLMSNRLGGRALALAASILILIGIGLVYQVEFSHGRDEVAISFSNYLSEFPEKPEAAQQIFLAKYDGRPVTMQEATNVLGYEPLVANGLPTDCSVEKVYLLDMPCCKCAQVLCKNEDGRSIAIFEHNTDQPNWFGERPAIECVCHDTPTSVVQVGDRLAATWKNGERYITVIGAKDLEEVTRFVSSFGGSQASS